VNLIKWYLKLYLVLLLALGYSQLLRKIVIDTDGFPSKYGAVIIATILVFALIAKSRELAVGKIWMWKTLFVVLAIASVIMLMFGVYLGFSGVCLSARLLCVWAIVLFPALQELYAHSYRSPNIWT
jgi:hypothetical protein